MSDGQHPFFQALDRWNFLKGQIAILQAEEKQLREGLFMGCFPDPREGVNKLELGDGRIIKGTHKINRKLDKDKYRDLIKQVDLTPTERKDLFKIETKLVEGVYKKLPDERKKIVDPMLIVTPGMPTLELVLPKEAE